SRKVKNRKQYQINPQFGQITSTSTSAIDSATTSDFTSGTQFWGTIGNKDVYPEDSTPTLMTISMIGQEEDHACMSAKPVPVGDQSETRNEHGISILEGKEQVTEYCVPEFQPT